MAEQIRSADLLVKTALADPEILNDLKTNPEETLNNLGRTVVAQLPRAIPPPDTMTSNAIWLIVVGSFAIVMLGAAYVLGWGVFAKLDDKAHYSANADMILTLFTTSVAFLAGLISPSPINKST
jgi:hypothetical protein